MTIKRAVFDLVKLLFFLYHLIKGGKYMNFTELIKNDDVLSKYDFETAYSIILRLLSLGYIMGK